MSQFDPFRQHTPTAHAGGSSPTPPQTPNYGWQHGGQVQPQMSYPAQPVQPHPTYPVAPQQPAVPANYPQPAAAPLRPVPLGTQQPAAPAQGTPAPTAPVPMNRPIPASTVPAAATPQAGSQAAAMRPVPVTTANRPVPVAAANRPVPVSAADPTNIAIDPDAGDETPPDPADKAIKSAPPWLVSTVVHMVIVIVLALITIPQMMDNQISLEIVYAEKLGEQVIDDTLQSPESLNMEVEVPELSFGPIEVDDPLAAPPVIDLISLDATNASAATIDAPSIGLALSGREAGQKKALLAAYGGNATTEEAVKLGLEWLARNQLKDGSWSLTGPFEDGGGNEQKVSATAMALLAFQGAGNTHQSGDFQKNVQRGWDYLLTLQNADGYFDTESPAHHRLYAQAQATIAICEIYGMTKDSKFRLPAQKALDFAHKAQAPEGGWRYEPRIDSDLSVTGWYVMALQSGMMAGLDVQSPTLTKIDDFLNRVAHEGGSRYSYKPGDPVKLTMTAEGLLCRQYLGWKHSDPRLQAGMEFLLANPINYSDQDVYYWYYATQALHHMDGDHWNRWNAVMRQAIPTAQTKTGPERGSWTPSGDRWGSHGGRLYVTCLSIYMLEVYYRHLPIYKYRLQ